MRRSGRAAAAAGESTGERMPRGLVNPAAGGFAQSVAGRRDERVAEREVELHRPGRDVREGAGGSAQGGLDGAERVVARRHVGGEADMLAEEVRLHGGLVGPGAAELLGPVGREDHERHGRMIGLHHGRHQVPDGGARGGQHGRGSAGGQGQTQRGEPGVAFVDPDQQLHPAGGVGLGKGVGHRRRTGPRRHHDVAHAGADQGRDGHPCGLNGAKAAVGRNVRVPGRAHMFSGVSMPSRSRPLERRRRTSPHRASRDSRTVSSALSTGHWS